MSEALKPFVFILGMHRSGTSCLAGGLERCGLRLGAVRRTGRFNVRGYYEIKALERLHEQILGLNGGTWHEPPAQNVIIHPYHQQELRGIVEQLSTKRPCGIKDPRLLLLLESWLELITPQYKLVGTFRHPLAVAKSLEVRNGLTKEKSIKLWLHYNSALVERHKQNPFPLLAFDLTDINSYCNSVATLALGLGLTPKHSHLHHFVSQKLDHHPEETVVPPVCEEIYNYLQHHRLKVVRNDKLSFKQFDKLVGTTQEAAFIANYTGQKLLDVSHVLLNKLTRKS